LKGIVVYIEGSGGYAISNIDLISHEIYFSKQAVMAQSQRFSCAIKLNMRHRVRYWEGLQNALNFKSASRLPLTVESYRPSDEPVRLNRTMMQNIRKSLLFVADQTPIFSNRGRKLPS